VQPGVISTQPYSANTQEQPADTLLHHEIRMDFTMSVAAGVASDLFTSAWTGHACCRCPMACMPEDGRILGHTYLWESRERELGILVVASLRHMACLWLAIPNRFFRWHGTPISIFVVTPEPAIHFWIMLAYLFPPGEPRLVYEYDSLTLATAFFVTCLHHVDV
jgi:hypothetical protein